MTIRDDQYSIRFFAKRLFRSASTISRELNRSSDGVKLYAAKREGH